MMRRFERRLADNTVSSALAGCSVNTGNLYDFVKRKRGKNSGERFREIRLSGPRRSKHQNVVPAARRDFKTSFRPFLTFNVGKIKGMRQFGIRNGCFLRARERDIFLK